MDVLHPRCAGLDVHKDSVVAAVRLAEAGTVRTEVRRFDTTTPGLLALGDWLAECGCTHAVMEATGVYWKPVWHVLSDGDLVLILANAAQVKNVPGRKTDVADASWLAELLAHGLVAPASCPSPRPRRCAPCCAPASSWSASRPATSSGCRRRWRTPTSSSARC
jgi:transposase